MSKKANPARDPFTFSLGGTTAIASFFPPFAIADDRINRIRDDRVKQGATAADRNSCRGTHYLAPSAHGNCA